MTSNFHGFLKDKFTGFYFHYLFIIKNHFSTENRIMVINATFNKTSAISWQSVILEKATRVPGDNHQLKTSSYSVPVKYFLFKRIIISSILFSNDALNDFINI